MKITRERVKEILAGLKTGKVYVGIGKENYGVGRIEMLDHLIHWEHFGASANKATIKDLTWVLETIFRDCIDVSEAVWSDYHINYIPKDPKYIGVDHSTAHPNVLGK